MKKINKSNIFLKTFTISWGLIILDFLISMGNGFLIIPPLVEIIKKFLNPTNLISAFVFLNLLISIYSFIFAIIKNMKISLNLKKTMTTLFILMTFSFFISKLPEHFQKIKEEREAISETSKFAFGQKTNTSIIQTTNNTCGSNENIKIQLNKNICEKIIKGIYWSNITEIKSENFSICHPNKNNLDINKICSGGGIILLGRKIKE